MKHTFNLLVLVTLLALTFGVQGVDSVQASEPAITIMAAPPAYYPFGPQTNVDESTLVGWELCWSAPYGSFGESLTSILTACDGDYLLLAGKPVGSTVFDVLAAAPRADVIFDTGTGDTPHDANGSGWYYNGDHSWGFANQGDYILRSSCDIAATAIDPGGPNGNLRLCWHTSGETINGGFRSGVNAWLNSEPSLYERFIYQPKNATRLLGTTGAGSGTSTLVELDPITGALISTIGPVGYLVNGLDYDPVSGNLYATTSNNDPSYPVGLITINMATGAGTPVAALSVGGCSYSVNNVRADASGTLYGWCDPNSDDLVTIDPGTGVVTVVGDSGIGTGGYGMSFDASNTLYFINGDGDIYTVSTVTGAATYAGFSIGGMAHHGDFHPDTGRYWGIDAASSGPKNIRVVNVSTGGIDATLPTVNDLHTLAFVAGSAPTDTTDPIVTVPSDITAEATSSSGAVVTFSASATDETSPANPAVSCSPASGSTFALGTTPVTCSAMDDAGNTGYGYFNVIVQDTTDPNFALVADNPYEATGPGGANAAYNASFSDDVSGMASQNCTPASGSLFPIGSTQVDCTGTDNAGNTSNVSFDIIVQDTTAPTLILPADIVTPQITPAGAVVNYAVSASDLVDASPSISCSLPSGMTYPVGTTTVTCWASDDYGNTSSGSFDITVTAAANLLQKADFGGAYVFPFPWIPSGFRRPYGGAIDCNYYLSASCSARFNASDRNLALAALQRVSRPGGLAGDAYSFGIYSAAKDAPNNGLYRVEITFFNGYRKLATYVVNFDPGTHGFELGTSVVNAPSNYTRIDFRFVYQKVAGTAWFDDAFLYFIGAP